MMPAGSYFRICASGTVQGRMAENTCCSRMRRAINCVYCPPKSRTTMPPRSFMSLNYDDIHKLVRNDHPLQDSRPAQQVCNSWVAESPLGKIFFGKTVVHAD